MATVKKTVSPEISIRILKQETCPSLTGKSKLTYHIGCTADSAIYIRIYSNSGGGFFSQEWLAWPAIEQTLKKVKSGVPINSIHLSRLFKGKSVNTPSFLMAALRHEKLVKPIEGRQRSNELGDIDDFVDRVNQLIASDVDIKVNEPSRLKAPLKKKTSNIREKRPVK